MSGGEGTEEFARAKVNLSLRILGRRGDGFHELQSLVVFPEVGDRLSATPAADFSLKIEGPFGATLEADEGNLVLKAARLLANETGRADGAHFILRKNLPVASGIGGGSADAAAALRALTHLWGVRLEETLFGSLAASVGADVPVCLGSRPAFMWGRGERVARISRLPQFSLLLVNPGVPVSTRSVFGALNAPSLNEMPTMERPAFPALDTMLDWLRENGNDLEAPARSLVPAIGDAIAAIEATAGCRLARMSGSGATCFGIYADEGEARAAAQRVAAAHPEWWVAAAPVGQ